MTSLEFNVFDVLFVQDVLKFGFSTREYVLLNEKSKVSEADEEDLSEEALSEEAET